MPGKYDDFDRPDPLAEAAKKYPTLDISDCDFKGPPEEKNGSGEPGKDHPQERTSVAKAKDKQPAQVPATEEKQVETASPSRILKGASLLQYSLRKINHQNTLLGNRYLCRGGGLFIVAPSGHGKSVLTAQAAVELACGMPTFGIPNPNGPLKSLIIQAEDDEDDITEMSQVISHLELSQKQREEVDANTHIEFINDLTGIDFLNACDGFLNQWKADILWVNPYTAYLGADIKDDGANSRFLRNGLNPILTAHRCGGIPIHHTPKTNNRDTTDWRPSDWMYSGAGAAVLTNWARAYLVIDPCDTHGLYKFIAAKRGRRIGWGDRIPIFETHWAHSSEEDKLIWVPVDDALMARASGPKTADDLLKQIPVLDPILQAKLHTIVSNRDGPCYIPEKKARDFIEILENEKKIFAHSIPRFGPDGKKLKAAIGYARTPPTEDE